MTGSFELAFLVNVGVVSGIGVHQSRIEEESFAGGEDQGFGHDCDGRLARNAAWFGHLGDAAFDHRSGRNYRVTVEHHGLCQACLERVTRFVAEGRESSLELDHEGRAGRYWRTGLRHGHGTQVRTCQQDAR